MSAHNLRELFVDQLRDVYDAEQRITKALPKMAKAAQSDQLRSAFENHLRQTEEHVNRLEKVPAKSSRSRRHSSSGSHRKSASSRGASHRTTSRRGSGSKSRSGSRSHHRSASSRRS